MKTNTIIYLLSLMVFAVGCRVLDNPVEFIDPVQGWFIVGFGLAMGIVGTSLTKSKKA